jgi:hypothetical protein
MTVGRPVELVLADWEPILRVGMVVAAWLIFNTMI